tara:strand:- start:192 stop:611 length:420 start_codon:yes stop_codon:yes gene_type:complete
MSDFNKAKLIIEKISNETSLKGIETIIDELSESINYFDNTKVSKEILDNQDYIDLCNYVQDAYLLLSIQGLNVQDFIDKLKQESKTDIYTYLDNYVYDDTEYETIEKYIMEDFKKLDKFNLYLLKNYIYNNLYNFLKNL